MTAMNRYAINPAHVRRRFDRAAKQFSTADFVHRRAGDGLLQRLSPISIQPQLILDLGSAQGVGSRQLAKLFKKSRVVSLDTSAKMLVSAQQAHGWFAKVHEVQADARQLPLQTGSVDLVFANMLLPLVNNIPACLAEVARVLRKGGAFLFSTFGPDSLVEIRTAWGRVDDGLHVHRFPDMHNLGDAVVHAGLRDPVLDVDYLTVTYRDTEALFRDLTAAGARNSLQLRRQSLTGKGRLASLREALQSAAHGGALQLKLELVFGHAWGGGPPVAPGEFHLAPSDIGRRHK